jgi:uncharacterized LabA/DUF88 family protein
MGDRTFVYVDGESHFIRSQDAWRKLHGQHTGLDHLRYIGQTDDRLILVDSRAKVFWTRKMNPGVHRAYYFTSAVGDEGALHKIKVTLRGFDLEPIVLPERSQAARQRRARLEADCLIEKPKGVDIALAVRMLEDSVHQAFDICHLYTSDIDFLPVIEAVRARGKQVCVHGYRDGLSSQSPFLHACDLFTDLEEMLRNQFEIDPTR